jgi:alpha-N-arabinofuranosidase
MQHPIGIAYDEWNVWYRTRTGPAREHGLEEQYDLSDALAVALFLNIFIRHCRWVEMANIAQLVNVIAPIFTSPDGLFLQTIYHPLRLYADHIQAMALDPVVSSPMLELESHRAPATPSDRSWDVADLGPFPALDVSATRDADRHTLVVCVINRHPTEAIDATLDVVGGQARSTPRVWEVNGPSVSATNSFAEPDVVTVRERDGVTTPYAFPAHSLTVLEFRV